MQAELRTKWVAALRERFALQGRGQLNQDGKMCCLGVLADVMGCEWRPVQGSRSSVKGLVSSEGAFCSGSLPVNVEREAGLTFNIQVKLVRLNDGLRKNFDEIADWVETNIPLS